MYIKKIFPKSNITALLVVCVSLIIAGLIIIPFAHFNLLKSKASAEEIENYMSPALEACKKEEYSSRCLKKLSKDFLNEFALTDILPVIKKHEKEEPYFSTCHSLAHYLGQEEFKRVRSVKKIYAQIDDTCLGGVYHGTIEGYFMAKDIGFDDTPENNTLVGNEVQIVCGKQEDYKGTNEYGNCVHGLGHALMYITYNDLPRALMLCDRVSTKDYQEICYTGALMQNFASLNDPDHPTLYAKKEDPLYPCNILEEKYQAQCYSYGALINFQNDPEKAIAICESIPPTYRKGCFKTYGMDRTMTNHSPEKILAECNLIKDDENSSICISEAARNLQVRFGLESTLAQTLCELGKPSYRNDCFVSVTEGAMTLTYDREKLRQFCNQLPSQEPCFERIQLK